MISIRGFLGFSLSLLVIGFASVVYAQDGKLSEILAGPVEKVAEGFKFTEGPVWHKDGYLLFSDIPANKIHQWTGVNEVRVYREDSGNSNGLTFDREGRLIACEHGNRRVSRTLEDGTVVPVAEAWEGKRLNSPNDCVVRSDGLIFFTDPPYGLRGDGEISFNGVYAVKPGGEVILLAKDFDRPNGIALSPDEKILYVADTPQAHVRSFDVAEDGSISNGKVLAPVKNPDGLKVDVEGRLYVTAANGVVVIDPSGQEIGVIEVPEQPANCGFGGEENKTLFITARSGLYKVKTKTAGVTPWTE